MKKLVLYLSLALAMCGASTTLSLAVASVSVALRRARDDRAENNELGKGRTRQQRKAHR